ncbi:MAG: nitrilase-related carbon-nitrogen hydrolase [Stackebrandtia sp.]
MDSDNKRGGLLRRTPPVLVAAASSATLFYFGTGFAPTAALTWLAPLPVLLLAPRVCARVALSAAFGAYLLGTANSWGYYLDSFDVPLPIGMAISFGSAAGFTLTVAAFRALIRRGRALLAAIVAPAVWTSIVYLAAVASPMGIMGTLATAQGDVPLMLQTAAVTGAWGVEYLVLLGPAAVAALLTPGVASAARVRVGAVGAAVLAIALIGGALRLAGDEVSEPPLRVALVVHNSSGWGTDVADAEGKALVDSYTDQLAALPDGVDLAVLPEGEFAADDDSLSILTEPMSRAAQERGMTVVVNYIHRADGEKRNLALAFPADGGEPVSYLKHHDGVSPPGDELVFVPDAPVGVGIQICMDLNFSALTRDYAEAGSRMLAIPASDEIDNGWQHSRTAVLRGVENGQSVAWSGRRGALTLADGYGRVLAETRSGGSGEFTVVAADVPPGPGSTPYTAMGDWFAWLCLTLAAAGVAYVSAGGRRVAPDASSPKRPPTSAAG